MATDKEVSAMEIKLTDPKAPFVFTRGFFHKVTKMLNFELWQKLRKKGASKYDQKLVIGDTFEDVIKVSVKPVKAHPKKTGKPSKNSK
jgi:hypothetical protein